MASPGPIVVGVEGTDRSADALVLALVLADRLGGQVLLVHAHPYGPLMGIVPEREYRALVRQVFDSTFHQVKELIGRRHQREMRVIAADSPAAGIQQVAANEQAQLIVVGPSRRSRVGRVRPGSTAERLLSGAPVPVAIAPAGYAQGQHRLGTVACGFDGSDESRLALDWASRLAQTDAARLLVASVHAPIAFGQISVGGAFSPRSANRALRDELKREQDAALAGLDVEAEAVVRSGDAARALVRASKDADVLVMGSRGYGPLRAIVLGGVSQYVVRHAHCPVVVCPRGADVAEEPGSRRLST